MRCPNCESNSLGPVAAGGTYCWNCLAAFPNYPRTPDEVANRIYIDHGIEDWFNWSMAMKDRVIVCVHSYTDTLPKEVNGIPVVQRVREHGV